MQAKLESSVYSSSIKIAPIECQRGGDHEGEVVSSVCLEPGCKFAVCCPVCLSEHQGHKTESIKIRIKNIRETLSGMGGKDTDACMLGDTIIETKRNMKQSVQVLRKTILESLDEVSELIDREFDMVEQRLKLLKDSNEELSKSIAGARKPEDLKRLMDHIHTLGTMLKPGVNPYTILATNIASHREILARLTGEFLNDFTSRNEKLKQALYRVSKLEEGKVPLQCDKKHNLIRCTILPPNYILGRYACDLCRSGGVISKNHPVWHCGLCNYDVCPSCADKK